jgi:hypothetical protein
MPSCSSGMKKPLQNRQMRVFTMNINGEPVIKGFPLEEADLLREGSPALAAYFNETCAAMAGKTITGYQGTPVITGIADKEDASMALTEIAYTTRDGGLADRLQQACDFVRPQLGLKPGR